MSTELKELTQTLTWRELIQQIPSIKWSHVTRTPEPHTQYLLFNRLDKTQPLHRNYLAFQEILPADPKPPLDGEKTLCFAVQLNPAPLVTPCRIITANQIEGQISLHLAYRVEEPIELIMAADDMLQDWVDYLHQIIQGLAKNQLDTEITIAGLEQGLVEIINDNNSKEKQPQEAGLIVEQISLLEPIEWHQENTEQKTEEETEVLLNPITREVTKEGPPEQPSQSLPPTPTQIANPSTDKEKELNPAPTQIDNSSMEQEKDSNEVTANSLNEQVQNLQAQRQALAEKERALNIQVQELEKKAQALAQREQALKIQEQALQQQQQLTEQTPPDSLNDAVVHKKPKKKKKGKLEEYAENQQETDNDSDDYDNYEEGDYEPYQPKRNLTPFIIIILVIILTIGISMFYFPTESAHFFHLLWGR